jgi:hypothetical protein
MHVPLSAIDRLDRRPSIDPFVKVFRLTFTDGKQVTLRAARGGNHGAAVIERLTDLIADGQASSSERLPSSPAAMRDPTVTIVSHE